MLQRGVSPLSDVHAKKCFALMRNLDISGVPVVDAVSGHMVANLSVSDLRCLRTPDDFDLLGLEVIRFAHARWESEANLEGMAHGAQPPTPGTDTAAAAAVQKHSRPAVVTVTLQASLLHVMETLVRYRVHRVYVEEKARPVSVVTITDVLRLFAVDSNNDPEGWLSF
jgi:CBS domain-containing protein